jgi:hypothetical protein
MMHPLVYYISQSTTDENNKALAARPGISSMERCPSGLRCMIGNHVDGEYRHGGSNPPLSATAEALSEMTELFSCFSGERDGYPGRGLKGRQISFPSASSAIYIFQGPVSIRDFHDFHDGCLSRGQPFSFLRFLYEIFRWRNIKKGI